MKIIKFFFVFILLLSTSKILNAEERKSFASQGTTEFEGDIGFLFETTSFDKDAAYYNYFSFNPTVQYYIINNLHFGLTPGFSINYAKHNDPNNIIKWKTYTFSPSVIGGYTIPLKSNILYFDFSIFYIYNYEYSIDTYIDRFSDYNEKEKTEKKYYSFMITPKLKYIFENSIINFGMSYKYKFIESNQYTRKHILTFNVGLSIFH